MNKSNKKSDLIAVIVTIIFLILPITLFVIWGIKSETEYVETKYNLFELNDGVYAKGCVTTSKSLIALVQATYS